MMYTKVIKRKDADLKAPLKSLFPEGIDFGHRGLWYYKGRPYTVVLKDGKNAKYDIAFRLASAGRSIVDDYVEFGFIERREDERIGLKIEGFSSHLLTWLDKPIGKAIELAEKDREGFYAEFDDHEKYFDKLLIKKR